MRAVVRRQAHELHRPALAIGQVAFLQAGEEGLDLGEGVLVGEVLDLRREGRRIRHHVVLQVDGQVDELPWHGKTSVGTRRADASLSAMSAVPKRSPASVGAELLKQVIASEVPFGGDLRLAHRSVENVRFGS